MSPEQISIGQMGPERLDTGQMGPEGHQDKWVPYKWVPDKWAPGQIDPGQMSPAQREVKLNQEVAPLEEVNLE